MKLENFYSVESKNVTSNGEAMLRIAKHASNCSLNFQKITSMYWFVLSVKPRNEIKIAQQLSDLGHQVYCPTISTIKQWSDRKKKVIEPLISTYIFIKIEEKNRADVFDVVGVVKYLFYLGAPAKVKDAEIEILKEYLHGSSLKSVIEKIKIGDDHIITEGPFKGKNGVVSEISNNRLQVVLKELGMKITFTNEA